MDTLCNSLEMTKLQTWRKDEWFPGVEGNCGYKRVEQGMIIMELLCILIVVVVTQIYSYDKTAKN